MFSSCGTQPDYCDDRSISIHFSYRTVKALPLAHGVVVVLVSALVNVTRLLGATRVVYIILPGTVIEGGRVGRITADKRLLIDRVIRWISGS